MLEISAQMSGRDEILGRIKEALRLKGHRPKRAGTSGEGARSDSTVHDWLPVVPNDHEPELRAQYYRLAGLPELSPKIVGTEE